MAKIMTKIIHVCIECDSYKKLDRWACECEQTKEKTVNDVAEMGFPESCPLPSPGSGILVFASDDEEKTTVRCHWDCVIERYILTFTNMNDKVVQLGFTADKWAEILNRLNQGGGR